MRAGLPLVVDTNILLVANEQHSDVSPECVIACTIALDQIRKHGIVVIDDGFRILSEYSKRTSPNTGNRVGDAFLKWLYQNSGNPQRVETVHIEDDAERGYKEFPDDVELREFDPSDRKFVAVAVSHRDRPTILQGTDSKWVKWSQRLLEHGIKIEFLCPTDVARFFEAKQFKKI